MQMSLISTLSLASMGLLSSGFTVKREVNDGIFPDVPPGFLAVESIAATIKCEVDGDGESAVDGIEHLSLKERMRMLLAGRPSGSSSGSELSGRVPTYCVDAAVTEEVRRLKRSRPSTHEEQCDAGPSSSTRAKRAVRQSQGCGQSRHPHLPRSSSSSSSSSGSSLDEEAENLHTSFVKISKRPIVCERKVSLKCLQGFDVYELLVQIGWDPILSFGGPVFEKLVRKFFSKCFEPVLHPPSFNVDCNGSVTHVTPARIAQLIGVPVSRYVPPKSDLASKDQRIEWTKFLCNGHNVAWHKGNALRASEMSGQFRLLHLIFVSNVYPRKGNRVDLTPSMVEILYHVGHHRSLCLPTLMMHQICSVLLSGHSSALPFGHLICMLAHECGFPNTTEPPLLVKQINFESIRKMKLSVPQDLAQAQEAASQAPPIHQVDAPSRHSTPPDVQHHSPPPEVHPATLHASSSVPHINILSRIASIEEQQTHMVECQAQIMEQQAQIVERQRHMEQMLQTIHRSVQDLALCFLSPRDDVSAPDTSG